MLDGSLEDESSFGEFFWAPLSKCGVESLFIESPYVVVEVAPQLLGRGVCFCKLASIVRVADFSRASLIGRNKYARNIVVLFAVPVPSRRSVVNRRPIYQR